MKPYIVITVALVYVWMMYLIIIQQQQIIELQKDRKQFTISLSYLAMKRGVESGEQFPVVGGEWYKCAKVITE